MPGEELREPIRKNPFYVSPWMYELLPKECEAIAKNYFNGEVVVLPKKYEGGADMKIVERKPVPIYALVCCECKSRIEYRKSEVSLSHITCPVCGMLNWAETITPVEMEEQT